MWVEGDGLEGYVGVRCAEKFELFCCRQWGNNWKIFMDKWWAHVLCCISNMAWAVDWEMNDRGKGLQTGRLIKGDMRRTWIKVVGMGESKQTWDWGGRFYRTWWLLHTNFKEWELVEDDSLAFGLSNWRDWRMTINRESVLGRGSMYMVADAMRMHPVLNLHLRYLWDIQVECSCKERRPWWRRCVIVIVLWAVI